jgi:CheY-like chemotaxis protein
MKTHALSIEDNCDFAQIFGHLLRVMDCELEAACNAESGLHIAERTHLDIIFCDIHLGGDMDGFAFARAVRANPILAHIPLVAVSAHAGRNDKEAAFEAGFNRILSKPIKFAEVADVLQEYRAEMLENSANRPVNSILQ